MEERKKWSGVAPGLRMAVGLEFPEENEPDELMGMIKHQAPAGAIYQIFYCRLPADWSSDGFHSLMGLDANRGELRFRRRAGHRVLFGRAGEKGPFGFTTGEYVTLRVNPEDRTEEPYKLFNPLFIRVDKGTQTQFLRVEAKWLYSMINISISKLNPDDKGIPDFLINLPEHLRVGENAYLLLD